jgi:glycerol uptake facilitator protein
MSTELPYHAVQEQKNKYKLFAAEFVGMTTFVGLSLSNIAMAGPSNMSWEGIAMAWGFNLLLGIKIANYGNSYLNPCIAACDFALGHKISLCEFGIYCLAEVLGAFTGAAIAYSLNYHLYPEVACSMFATGPAPGVTNLQAFGVELIGTMLFALNIFKIVKSGMNHAEYAIALSLTAIVLSLGYQSAFSYNWARDFGPRLFTLTFDSSCFAEGNYWFIPLTANFIGAGIGWALAEI